jgi:hypothetical protein
MFGSSSFSSGVPVKRERRDQRRQRVLLGGRIGYLGSNFRCDCTVRDLTDEGAKIVALTAFLPRSDPFLLVMSRAVLYQSRIVWSSDGAFGLSFSTKWDLVESMTSSPDQFRSWWVDLAKG